MAIALDTKGPEIRTGLLKGVSLLQLSVMAPFFHVTYLSILVPAKGGTAEIELKQGDRIKLSTDKRYFDCGDKNTIYVDYVNIINTMSVNDLVFIDDGLISVKVLEKGVDYLLTGLL